MTTSRLARLVSGSVSQARNEVDTKRHQNLASPFGGTATRSFVGVDPTLGRPSWLASSVGSLMGQPPESSDLKAFIVVNRRTRKIVAEFGTREEAEAFRDGLISAQANGKSDLSIRSTLRESTDQEAGAAQRAEKRGRTAHPLRRKQSRGPGRPRP
jgi:alkylated DNA nucleotide flippase Atl1